MIHIQVIGWTVQALLVAISTMQLLSVYAASHTLEARCTSQTVHVLLDDALVMHRAGAALGMARGDPHHRQWPGHRRGTSTPALLPIVALTIILNIVTIH